MATTTTTNPHYNIQRKLDSMIERSSKHPIPHLLFSGESGTGKHTLLRNFVWNMYKDDVVSLKKYVLELNCALGVGVNEIREKVSFFGEMSMRHHSLFKTIVLFNADQLTYDAQSALRRGIEKYSEHTRFIMSVTHRDQLMDPILSRLCEIAVPFPVIGRKRVNLHQQKRRTSNANKPKVNINNGTSFIRDEELLRLIQESSSSS